MSRFYSCSFSFSYTYSSSYYYTTTTTTITTTTTALLLLLLLQLSAVQAQGDPMPRHHGLQLLPIRFRHALVGCLAVEMPGKLERDPPAESAWSLRRQQKKPQPLHKRFGLGRRLALDKLIKLVRCQPKDTSGTASLVLEPEMLLYRLNTQDADLHCKPRG